MIQLIVQLWYLDNLNHVVCLPERFSTPRIKYWTKERIQDVSVGDRVRTGEYGRLDVSELFCNKHRNIRISASNTVNGS